MENKKTCLYERHVALGALMQPFGGFIMPIQYSDIADEHNAVRLHVGVFDVSHMGEVSVSGADATRFVNHIFTNQVEGMEYGKIVYGMMCMEDGGVVDDLLVYRMQGDCYLLVINAANIDKDLAWIRQQAEGYDVEVKDLCDSYGQLAVQGPESEQVVCRLLGQDVSDLVFYTFKELRLASGEEIVVSRTGYTGEDGFEIYASPAQIQQYWDTLINIGVKPCGLGCRDTLRFEVGLPLYGDELSEQISPIMAGLGIFVKLDKQEFIGREALLLQKTEGVARRLIGIELQDKAIPRHGYTVLSADGQPIGEVTTGYHSLSTDKSVCMALVDTAYAKLDTPVSVQIRKKVFPGKVVKKRFYDKHYKK